jgi:hypothetical protein
MRVDAFRLCHREADWEPYRRLELKPTPRHSVSLRPHGHVRYREIPPIKSGVVVDLRRFALKAKICERTISGIEPCCGSTNPRPPHESEYGVQDDQHYGQDDRDELRERWPPFLIWQIVG